MTITPISVTPSVAPIERANWVSAVAEPICRTGTTFWTAITNTCIISPSPTPAMTMFLAASRFVVDAEPPEQEEAGRAPPPASAAAGSGCCARPSPYSTLAATARGRAASAPRPRRSQRCRSRPARRAARRRSSRPSPSPRARSRPRRPRRRAHSSKGRIVSPARRSTNAKAAGPRLRPARRRPRPSPTGTAGRPRRGPAAGTSSPRRAAPRRVVDGVLVPPPLAREAWRAQAQRDHADRHVDVEDPAPARVVDDEAAQRRAADRARGEGCPDQALVAAALPRWDDDGDRRVRKRKEPARAEPLDDAVEDQLGPFLRDAAKRPSRPERARSPRRRGGGARRCRRASRRAGR